MKAAEMLDMEIHLFDQFDSDFADMHRWVRENGQEFTGIDWEGSHELAKVRTPEMNSCYHNTLLVRDYRDESLLYYEGWCDFGIGVPMHHAWNVRDGVVLDVTLTLPNWEDKRDTNNISYFGVEVPYDWAREHVPHKGMRRPAMSSGPFMYDWASMKHTEQQEVEA